MPKVLRVAIFLAASMVLAATAGEAAKKKKPEPLAAKFKPLTGEAAAEADTAIKDALEKAANTTSSVRGTGVIEAEFARKKNVKEFTFWIKKPGKLRLEFTAPEDIKGVVMVTDGKTFWNHIPAMKKTYKVDLKQGSFEGRDQPLQKELGMLLALVNTPLEREAFWKKFELVPLGDDTVDGRDCYVAEFKTKPDTKKKKKKSRKEEGLFNQYLWIEKETGLTWQIELLVFGVPELVKIKTIKLNPKIDDALFTMKE